jgi:hypothetical protein
MSVKNDAIKSMFDNSRGTLSTPSDEPAKPFTPVQFRAWPPTKSMGWKVQAMKT